MRIAISDKQREIVLSFSKAHPDADFDDSILLQQIGDLEDTILYRGINETGYENGLKSSPHEAKAKGIKEL